MCLWGFFPIVFPLKWSLKIHWGFRGIYNSVSRFLPLWDLLLCVFQSKSISGVSRCSFLIFPYAAPIQPDAPSQIFWEFIPRNYLLPSIPAAQCQGLLSLGLRSDPVCWCEEQTRRWAVTLCPSTWVPRLPHWFMLTSTVMCLTWWCPTWGEEGISAVPNKFSASLVTPAFFSRTSWRESDIYPSQYTRMPAAGGDTTQLLPRLLFLPFFFLFTP